jgi:hypothetical protein
VSTAPLPPGLRPGGAVEIERDLEHPSIRVSADKSQVFDLADLRFQRAVARLHRLGERPLGAFLAELSGRLMIRTEVEQLLAAYSRLDPAMVEAVGADRFAPIPLHEVTP